LLILILHMLGLFIADCIYLDLIMIMQPIQKMYEKYQQYFLDDPQFLLINLGNTKYNFLKLFDQSNLIYLTYKKLNKSTMNNKHQVASMVYH